MDTPIVNRFNRAFRPFTRPLGQSLREYSLFIRLLILAILYGLGATGISLLDLHQKSLQSMASTAGGIQDLQKAVCTRPHDVHCKHPAGEAP